MPVGRTVLADRRQVSADVVVKVDEEAVGPGQARAATGKVVLIGDRLAERVLGLAGYSPEGVPRTTE
ncbi:hypothetical protein D3C71_1079500 [compost metagenome]